MGSSEEAEDGGAGSGPALRTHLGVCATGTPRTPLGREVGGGCFTPSEWAPRAAAGRRFRNVQTARANGGAVLPAFHLTGDRHRVILSRVYHAFPAR